MAIQTKPEYRESNPKIDIYILDTAGNQKYYASTNYWRTCRDCLNYYNATLGNEGFRFVRAYIDRSAK